MKIYTGRTDIKLFEHLIDEPNQTVTHLVLKSGQEVPEHKVSQTVIVVPIKGRIDFSNREESQEIYPGRIVRMAPDEWHALRALEDSELMVVKSSLVV